MEVYEKRQFMIFDVTELSKINFNEVLETSEDTVRKSIDGTKTFVKWNSITIPLSVEELITKIGPYTYSEIVEILLTNEWIDNEELIII